jgi:peptidyl-prolyl cis-trans isomerase D
MSTLEQIRQRPVLIISILGVALLLFILTAVDRPQELFSDNHTVAKVDGEKIDYLEFQKRVEQVQQNYQNQGYNNVDRDQLQTEVLQEMIQETLLKNEYARLGLTVTDNELSKAILGETPHPYVLQMMQQMGIGDPKMFYDAVANPQKQGIQENSKSHIQHTGQEDGIHFGEYILLDSGSYQDTPDVTVFDVGKDAVGVGGRAADHHQHGGQAGHRL